MFRGPPVWSFQESEPKIQVSALSQWVESTTPTLKDNFVFKLFNAPFMNCVNKSHWSDSETSSNSLYLVELCQNFHRYSWCQLPSGHHLVEGICKRHAQCGPAIKFVVLRALAFVSFGGGGLHSSKMPTAIRSYEICSIHGLQRDDIREPCTSRNVDSGILLGNQVEDKMSPTSVPNM